MSGAESNGLSPLWARWYRRALPTYWVFLFCTTHFPKLSFGTHVPRNTDKAAHFITFALLAFAFWRFNQSFGRPISARFVWFAAPILMAYAALDEYLQRFVNRSPDVFDWLWNSAGIVTVLIWLEIRRRRPKSAEKPGDPPLESGSSRT